MTNVHDLALFGTSLGIGILIGIERGWHHRESAEGARVAGLRTYGLIGVLGGAAGLLAKYLSHFVLGFMFVGLAGILTAAYLANVNRDSDAGITSLIAGLLTFGLGALSTLDHVGLAAPAAVVTAMLLRFKPLLHRWLQKLEERELHAALQLLAISIVVLPVLPDRGFGPWNFFNPYDTWWMVVLIATISFSGYLAMRIVGTQKGVLLTALFAGIVSSTALTLHYSRLSREEKGLEPLIAAGILLACGTMFLRLVLIVGIIHPPLIPALSAPAGVMASAIFLSALYQWRHSLRGATPGLTKLPNPLELKFALMFGLMLALVVFLSTAVKEWFGERGLYMVALASGLVDVDAISLSLSRMSSAGLSIPTATLGILIAATANTAVKAVIASIVGVAEMRRRVTLPLILATLVGLGTAILAK